MNVDQTVLHFSHFRIIDEYIFFGEFVLSSSGYTDEGVFFKVDTVV